MARWTCPNCERQFDRRNQAHTCHPANDIARTFKGFPETHMKICQAIIAYLHKLGPLHVDPVLVGVFLKTQRTIAEVRPKQRWVSLGLVLPEVLTSPRVTRHQRISDQRVMHMIKLFKPGDLDEEIKRWLEQAYDAATD